MPPYIVGGIETFLSVARGVGRSASYYVEETQNASSAVDADVWIPGLQFSALDPGLYDHRPATCRLHAESVASAPGGHTLALPNRSPAGDLVAVIISVDPPQPHYFPCPCPLST